MVILHSACGKGDRYSKMTPSSWTRPRECGLLVLSHLDGRPSLFIPAPSRSRINSFSFAIEFVIVKRNAIWNKQQYGVGNNVLIKRYDIGGMRKTADFLLVDFAYCDCKTRNVSHVEVAYGWIGLLCIHFSKFQMTCGSLWFFDMYCSSSVTYFSRAASFILWASFV